MKKEAILYERHSTGAVTCGICQRRCVVPIDKAGWCQTRINEQGKLYSQIYGEVSSLSVNPIEKKPVYHFLPGSRWLSLGSLGCNFRCPGCQNWEIAHWKKGIMAATFLSPEDSVVAAKEQSCAGISWTFNEPTLWFEYTLDAAKLAKAQGLYTNYVTNGYITAEAFDMLAPFLDVYRVDIKGFSKGTYKKIGHVPNFKGILAVSRKAKDCGMHVEVVTNIIPGINDSPDELQGIAAWIRDNLGPETPWHVTCFFPHHRLRHLAPTSVTKLEETRRLGKEAGLWYVYLGNVPGHQWENTFCHKCETLLIERFVFNIIQNRVSDGKCPQCGTMIPGRF